MKHTAGPWYPVDRGTGWEIHWGDSAARSCWCDRPGCDGALPDGFRTDIAKEADAHLIAAAPELLAALVELVGAIGDAGDFEYTTGDAGLYGRVRAAIAKALNEQVRHDGGKDL